MSTRASRVARGLIVAFVSLLVAALAHVAAGGRIGGVGFALALAFSSVVSVGLSGRTVSSVRVGIAVVFSQGLFHLLFGVGSNSPPSGQAHPAGLTMAGMGDPHATLYASAVLPASSASMANDGWMWVAHAVAAALTIAALVKGERTFWRLADWVAYALAPVAEPLAPLANTRRVAPPAQLELRAPGARFLIAGMRHRGPPPRGAST